MKALLPTVALCAALSACGADSNDTRDPELTYTRYQSSIERDQTPDLNNTQFRQLVQDNNQFALDLFHLLHRDAQTDIVASPLSISTTLAMTYAGASGATKQQMAQALQFNQEDALLHAGFNRLTAAMTERQLPAEGASDALEIQIVNAIWTLLGSLPASGFLDPLALNYGNGVYALDFINEPEDSRLAINNSVSDWTAGLINDLLPSGAITDLTRVVLTNTIYLKAPWHEPFPAEATQLGDFTNVDGSTSPVDVMTAQSTVHYAAHDDAEVVILPFRGKELEMAFIMPNAGTFEEYLAQAEDMTSLSAELDGATEIIATIRLPKFEHSFNASLIEPLKSLGMIDAFDDSADFTAMGLSEDLRLTAVEHKAVIEIDEGGVVAAAATAAVGGNTSVPMPVNVDRPFIYLIRDRTSGALLFIGSITQL